MKVRTDILRMYKDIHSWVGIVSGLALFIAFYAGAITMFEQPLQRWASPPAGLAAPVPLERTPELVRAVLAAHPEAAKRYTVHLETSPEEPARVSWQTGDEHEGTARTFHAALARDGSLQVAEQGPSPVGQFIDDLHQQIGLMFDHEIAMPIMGGVALLYFIALVSGVIVLLPSLVKDLFALRLGKNAKRMWLDLHNLLGLFSLPFHIVMALTSVVFAFHDQFYDTQAATFAKARAHPPISAPPAFKAPSPLAPAQLVSRIETERPGFTPAQLAYGQGPGGVTTLRVLGRDPRYTMIMPNYSFVQVDPATGEPIVTDYIGGSPASWGGTVGTFFSLHFGSFGGAGVRWAYALLGLSGAFVFYTGNLLWIESRRKRERKSGAVRQSRSTQVLGALTVGVPLGAMAGIALTIAAAKPLGLSATPALHSLIYHTVFLGFVAWALLRGSARATIELMPGAALTLVCIPLSSLIYAPVHPAAVPAVDLMALVTAIAMTWAWRSSLRRIRFGPTDSVWSVATGSSRPEASPGA